MLCGSHSRNSGEAYPIVIQCSRFLELADKAANGGAPMYCRRNSLAMFLLMASLASSLLAQETRSLTTAVVPQLVNFAGKAIDAKGNVVSGIMGITLSIYTDQYEGAPLWSETQNVTADTKGNYSIQLGATKTDGLPLELFSTGEARWLGVRINGGEEQARVLLLSVPYALKAADAQTLAGLPASAFVLASPTKSSSAIAAHTSAKAKSDVTAAISGGGTSDYIPLWTNGTTLGNSALYQVGTKVGLNTNTPATALDVTGKINASAGFDLGGNTFAIGSYKNGNALLGFAGNAATNSLPYLNTAVGVNALHSNTTGTTNTAVGYGTLFSNTTGTYNVADGIQVLYSNTTGGFNTAMGASALYSNTSGSGNIAIGESALLSNTTASDNTAVGDDALETNKVSTNNTAVGYQALFYTGENSTTGGSNTGIGSQALYFNMSGAYNTASGASALQSNTTGQYN